MGITSHIVVVVSFASIEKTNPVVTLVTMILKLRKCMRSQFNRKRRNESIRKEVRKLEHLVRMDACRNTDSGFLINDTDHIQSLATSTTITQSVEAVSPP